MLISAVHNSTQRSLASLHFLFRSIQNDVTPLERSARVTRLLVHDDVHAVVALVLTHGGREAQCEAGCGECAEAEVVERYGQDSSPLLLSIVVPRVGIVLCFLLVLALAYLSRTGVVNASMR